MAWRDSLSTWSASRPAAIAASFVVATAAILWILGTDPLEFRRHLTFAQFWSLELCVASGLATGAWILRDIARELTRRDVMTMAGVAAFAACLTLFVAPRTNRIYYDEQIYQGVGQNLADLRLAQMCNDGSVEYGRLQCWAGEYNKQPYGYPHLLSIAYRLVGVRGDVAFVVNLLTMVATTLMAYVAAIFLFKGDRVAAFFASLLLAFLPQQLLWSATAAVEPSASLACLTSVAAVAYFAHSRSTSALVAVGVSTAYAVQFRPESILILPVIAWLMWRRAPSESGQTRFWWVGVLTIGLLAVHIGHLVAVRNEGWGTTDAMLSLRYVADNFRVNGGFYVWDERFPIVVTLLALVGLTDHRSRDAKVALTLYFLLFFGIGLLFYAGSYNYGADVRYSLMTYPPLVLLAGLGASTLTIRLANINAAVRWTAVLTAALLFQFLSYLPQVRATTEEAWAARADVRFAESLVPVLRGNSYVLTHNPGMFHVWGVNAGQMSLAFNDPTRLKYLATRFTGGVYLHWNFWCNVQVPVQQDFCRKVLAIAPARAVQSSEERGQRLVLYRFEEFAREE